MTYSQLPPHLRCASPRLNLFNAPIISTSLYFLLDMLPPPQNLRYSYTPLRGIWGKKVRVTGVIDEALARLLLGALYLLTGRNLSVPIIAHGIQDTIDFLLAFLGKYPGM
jgi:membrane protease YdiL (CAAX protease family)